MAIEQLDPKEFAKRIHHCLDEMEAPSREKERVSILIDLMEDDGFELSRHEAQNLIQGRQLPTSERIDQLAAVLEVDPEWLAGKRVAPHP